GGMPAARRRVDVATLPARANHAAHIAQVASIKKNPPAQLGAVIGTMAQAGRDKLTLITPRPLDTLGLWVEQLIAESTGKEGKGAVRSAGEPSMAANESGNERPSI